ELISSKKKYQREGLVLDTAKIMIDGIPENETAAMLDRTPRPNRSVAVRRARGWHILLESNFSNWCRSSTSTVSTRTCTLLVIGQCVTHWMRLRRLTSPFGQNVVTMWHTFKLWIPPIFADSQIWALS